MGVNSQQGGVTRKKITENDEFGYSPDIGKFVVRGGKTYTEYGHVHEPKSGMAWRSMSWPADSFENYADWTDERRAARVAEVALEAEEYEKKREAERAARRVLVTRAKEKLTEEEFNAVLSYAHDDE